MTRFSSISDYHIQLANGSTTCVAAVRFFMRQIAQRNSLLNAFIELWEAEALERAAELDAQLAKGKPMLPLHGVVMGLKDVFHYQGHQVSAASKMLSGYTATYTATVVQRLLDAGAIFIGRQNCDEFAMGSANENSVYGPSRNAADPQRISGGSSGGSAVAVQAGMCMASLGSDTGGSVRQPASHCGIVGLKPGYGQLSRYGLIAYASSFDVPGILAATVDDAFLLQSVMAGPDPLDPTATLQTPDLTAKEGTYRFCYWKETLEHPGLDEEIRQTTLTFFHQLRAAGHEVVAVDFPLLPHIVPAYYVLTTAEASSNLSRFDGLRFGHQAPKAPNLEHFYTANRSEGFGREVKRRIMLGNFVLSTGYYDAFFTKAQQVRQLLKKNTEELLGNYDAILSPVVPAVARLVHEADSDPVKEFLADIFTVSANLIGLSAISLPLFSHKIGMAYGLQCQITGNKHLHLHRISGTLVQLASKQ